MEEVRFPDNAVTIEQVQRLTTELYIPFTEIDRDIAWPVSERMENDAEHTVHLGIVGIAIGEKLGLNVDKIAKFTVVHDLKERFSGDTSLLDFEGRKTKELREKIGLDLLEEQLNETPAIIEAIKEYEEQSSDEACFVYALDKLIATVMVIEANGQVWKNHGLTFEEYEEKVYPIQYAKMSVHPEVLRMFCDLWQQIVARKDELFILSEVRLQTE